MIVSVIPAAEPPYALVEGISSGRALATFIRAARHWYAFGRHDYVMVDLDSFGDWSPQVADELAAVAGAAADAGHWLAFFPVASHWVRGASDDRFHSFPDRVHAQRAMQQHWALRLASAWPTGWSLRLASAWPALPFRHRQSIRLAPVGKSGDGCRGIGTRYNHGVLGVPRPGLARWCRGDRDSGSLPGDAVALGT
jgi:hypothetical protein